MHKFVRNGVENGRTAWMFQRKKLGSWMTYGFILWSGTDWLLRTGISRIERFDTLREAKLEAIKI